MRSRTSNPSCWERCFGSGCAGSRTAEPGQVDSAGLTGTRRTVGATATSSAITSCRSAGWAQVGEPLPGHGQAGFVRTPGRRRTMVQGEQRKRRGGVRGGVDGKGRAEPEADEDRPAESRADQAARLPHDLDEAACGRQLLVADPGRSSRYQPSATMCRPLPAVESTSPVK